MKNILFLHGNSLSPETFNFQKDYFQSLGYNVIIPNLNNVVENLIPETFSKGISDELTKINNETPVDYIVGHSLGGHLAIECLPVLKNVKGITIFGTPPISKPPKLENAFFPVPEIGLFYNPELSEEEINKMAELISPDSKVEIFQWIKNSNPNLRICAGGSIAGGFYDCETSIVKELKYPIAVLHGEKDAFINPNYFSEIEIPTLWKNKVQVLKEASHMPQMDKPDEFNLILTEFINYCESLN